MTDTNRHKRMLGECARAFVALVGGYEKLADLASVEELWDKYHETLEQALANIGLEDLKGMGDAGPDGSIGNLILRAPKKQEELLVNKFFVKVAVARTVFAEASGPSHKKTVTGMAAPGWDDRPHSIAPSPSPEMTAPQSKSQPAQGGKESAAPGTQSPQKWKGPMTELLDAATPEEESGAWRRIGLWLLALMGVILLSIGGGSLIARIVNSKN